MSAPRSTHVDVTSRIVRYGDHGVHGHLRVESFTDADWVRSPSSRRSPTVYCIVLGGNLMTWKSKKQTVVVRSSVEAEYRGMAYTSCELM